MPFCDLYIQRFAPAKRHDWLPKCYALTFKSMGARKYRSKTIGKTPIFLSRENRQTCQTCDHTKKHITMTKQDRAMRFSRRSSSNSLLEITTYRAPLGRRNGGLFWTFGNFPDSPCMWGCCPKRCSEQLSPLTGNYIPSDHVVSTDRMLRNAALWETSGRGRPTCLWQRATPAFYGSVRCPTLQSNVNALPNLFNYSVICIVYT
jgi:hypothetical protein